VRVVDGVIIRRQSKGEKVKFVMMMPVDVKRKVIELSKIRNQSVARTVTELVVRGLKDLGMWEELAT